MADQKTAEMREEVSGDASYYKDPKAIVNYTIGWIIAFVVVALIAIFAIGVYFSANRSGVTNEAGQSEKRANP